MKRSGWLLLAAAGVAALGGVLWVGRPAPQPEVFARVAAVPAPAPSLPSPVPAELPEAPAVDPTETAPDPEIESARLALIHSDETLLARAKQQRLAEAADARWNAAVDDAGYTAEDLDSAVRELFRTMRLEPHYLEGGEIEGLVIEEMAGDHPLARAGFRVGDRLSRIQGVELRDPAVIPSLLARLGPHISFCADREGTEVCEEIILE